MVKKKKRKEKRGHRVPKQSHMTMSFMAAQLCDTIQSPEGQAWLESDVSMYSFIFSSVIMCFSM